MRSRFSFTIFGAGLLIVSFLHLGRAQQLTRFAEVATGEGTLTSTSGERSRITAVAVFLQDDGQAEVRLMTEKTGVAAGGRWFRYSDASREIALEITGDTEGGRATGCATVVLQEGCVPIARLTITLSRPDGTTYEGNFMERKSRPCPTP